MKTKEKVLLMTLLFVMALAGCEQTDTFTIASETGHTIEESQKEESATIKQDNTAEACIYIYVCGHVKQPGVYQLSADARICDALVKAGGVSEDGNAEALAQAEHMTDGQTIYVPGMEEKNNGEANTEDDGLVNINTAGKEELMTLPGIGESKAVTILQYREEHGSFQSVEELMEIPGIKEGVFNKIKSSIKVT